VKIIDQNISIMTIGDVAADRKNLVPLLAVMNVPLEAENHFVLIFFENTIKIT